VSQALPDVDDVEPLGLPDEACIDELRAVLARHGALNRFGITLLHDHFDLEPDEVLVETCDKQGRVLTMRPVKASALSVGTLVETQWQLTPEGAAQRQVCKVGCFSDLKGKHNHVHDRVWEN
jgi:hypothetical protein